MDWFLLTGSISSYIMMDPDPVRNNAIFLYISLGITHSEIRLKSLWNADLETIFPFLWINAFSLVLSRWQEKYSLWMILQSFSKILFMMEMERILFSGPGPPIGKESLLQKRVKRQLFMNIGDKQRLLI